MSQCKHLFCIDCFNNSIKFKTKCPMCREPFNFNFLPKINLPLQNAIQFKFPSEFLERKKLLQAQSLWNLNNISIKFNYGNKYKEIKAKNSYKSTLHAGCFSIHAWKLFVELDAAGELTGEIVKTVDFNQGVFSLVEPNVKIGKYPFEIERRSDGYFEIGITVNFYSWTKLKPVKLSHTLYLDENGEQKSFHVEIEKKILEKREMLWPELDPELAHFRKNKRWQCLPKIRRNIVC